MGTSHVAALLKAAAETGDFQDLQEAAYAVEAFLEQNDARFATRKLMEMEDFLPFLLNCLMTAVILPALRITVVGIIEALLRNGSGWHIRQLVSVGMVPSLVALFNFADPCDVVHKPLMLTLGLMAEHLETKGELRELPVSIDLLKALNSYLRSANPSKNILVSISRMVFNILVKDPRGKTTTAMGIPPLSVVEEALPVISALLDSNNEEIVGNQLQSICVCLLALNSFTPFINNGLSPKLTEYLNREKQLREVVAAFRIISSKDPCELLSFLKSLRGSNGLKNLWRCINSDWVAAGGEHMIKALKDFVSKIGNLVNISDNKTDSVFIIVESGFAHALATALTRGCPKMYENEVVIALGKLASSLPPFQLQDFVKMDVLSVMVKKIECVCTDDEGGSAAAAAATFVSKMICNSALRRNQALTFGVLPRILAILRKQVTRIGVHCDAMMTLQCILEIKPRHPLQNLENVFEALTKFFYEFPIFLEEDDVFVTIVERREVQLKAPDCVGLVVTAFSCVQELIEYGREGISAIFQTRQMFGADFGRETRCLARKMMDYFSCCVPELQEKAVQLVLQICQLGCPGSRQSLLSWGFLASCNNLLKASSHETRKVTLECLLHFRPMELHESNQKAAFYLLRPIVIAEIGKGNASTLEVAKAVYNRMVN